MIIVIEKDVYFDEYRVATLNTETLQVGLVSNGRHVSTTFAGIMGKVAPRYMAARMVLVDSFFDNIHTGISRGFTQNAVSTVTHDQLLQQVKEEVAAKVREYLDVYGHVNQFDLVCGVYPYSDGFSIVAFASVYTYRKYRTVYVLQNDMVYG